jgi:hypothetical protein
MAGFREMCSSQFQIENAAFEFSEGTFPDSQSSGQRPLKEARSGLNAALNVPVRIPPCRILRSNTLPLPTNPQLLPQQLLKFQPTLRTVQRIASELPVKRQLPVKETATPESNFDF